MHQKLLGTLLISSILFAASLQARQQVSREDEDTIVKRRVNYASEESASGKLVVTHETDTQQQGNSATKEIEKSIQKTEASLKSNKFVLNYDEPTSYFETNSLESRFNQRLSFDDYLSYTMRALALVAATDTDVHRYDQRNDLLNSFTKRNIKLHSGINETRSEIAMNDDDDMYDVNNQIKCGQHLDALLKEINQLFADFNSYSSSSQLNLIDYLDSFGSPSSQLMKGNTMWLGSHEQCLRAKIGTITTNFFNEDNSNTNQQQELRTRYCVANLRSPRWPILGTNEHLEKIGSQSSIKLGICLPETCNSISISNHASKIELLLKLTRLNQLPYSGYKLTNLFCLPDESSPLRQFSLSARLFIVLLSSWLTIIVYFSLKYEYQRIKWIQSDENTEGFTNLATTSNCMKIFALRLSWSKLFESQELKTASQPAQQVIVSNEIQQVESTNLDKQIYFDFHQQKKSNSNLIEASKHQQLMAANNETGKPNSISLGSKTAATTTTTNNNHQQAKIDLSVIDGIKVLSMIWLVSAHTLLFFIRTIANGRDFWSILRDARFITVVAGIFTVDTFFTVTGVLTAFLKFNKNNGQAMRKVTYWIEAFVHRYLRFMPLYLIVFWYTRDVSEYIGFGPMWDYATADTSLRSVCKQESVTVPLFFRANFKSIDQHCVKPAWYLANDYQYLLMTPIFMALILRSKPLGYMTIIGSVILSLILQFFTVFYSNDIEDSGVLINFKPLFGAYILKNLWKLYVLPYNRIPPYLIGLLTGHLMYSFIKFNTEAQSERQKQFDDSISQHSNNNNHHHRETSNSRIGMIRSQDSLTSMPSISTHCRSNSDIIKKTSRRNNKSTVSFIGALRNYLCIRVWIPLVFLISIVYLPLLTKLTTHEGLTAKIGSASLIALMRFVWSIAIARLIFICSTRSLEQDKRNKEDSFIIRFLSSSKWKPWSKIGYSALLIQWEIIAYLAQTQAGAPNLTITFLLSVILVCLVATYALALLIYLTIEYPLSQVEHLYIHPVFFRKG